jgi:hypothetical protein
VASKIRRLAQPERTTTTLSCKPHPGLDYYCSDPNAGTAGMSGAYPRWCHQVRALGWWFEPLHPGSCGPGWPMGLCNRQRVSGQMIGNHTAIAMVSFLFAVCPDVECSYRRLPMLPSYTLSAIRFSCPMRRAVPFFDIRMHSHWFLGMVHTRRPEGPSLDMSSFPSGYLPGLSDT